MSPVCNSWRMLNVEQLQFFRESEDHVEFKAAKHNYPFAGGQHNDVRERRKCVLGYVVALANERGGLLVLAKVDNPALHIFIMEEQARRDNDHQLNAFQLFALYSISKGENPKVDEKILQSMISEGLVIINNKSDKGKYELNANYTQIISKLKEISNKETVKETVKETAPHLTDVQLKVLKFCSQPKSAKEIFAHLNLTVHSYNYKVIIHPLLQLELLKPTMPDTPRARGQKYITNKSYYENINHRS